MNKRKILIASSVVVLLASGYMVASAPIKKSARTGRGVAGRSRSITVPPSASIPTPESLARLSTTPPYQIEPTPIRGNVKPRTREQDAVFQEAATIMSRKLPVPPDRVQFFSWANGVDVPFTINGWAAFVHQVSPIPGGWAVTLKVWPKVTDGVRVLSAYYEEYTWANGNLNFVRGYGDPKTPGINYVN